MTKRNILNKIIHKKMRKFFVASDYKHMLNYCEAWNRDPADYEYVTRLQKIQGCDPETTWVLFYESGMWRHDSDDIRKYCLARKYKMQEVCMPGETPKEFKVEDLPFFDDINTSDNGMPF